MIEENDIKQIRKDRHVDPISEKARLASSYLGMEEEDDNIRDVTNEFSKEADKIQQRINEAYNKIVNKDVQEVKDKEDDDEMIH